MTAVVLRPPSKGQVTFTPTAQVGQSPTLPGARSFLLSGSPVVVRIPASGPDWYYQVTEAWLGGRTRNVVVPQVDRVEYDTLGDVDPDTLVAATTDLDADVAALIPTAGSTAVRSAMDAVYARLSQLGDAAFADVADLNAGIDLGSQPGVDMTGTNECAAAVQAALDSAAAFGQRVHGRGTIRTSSTLTIDTLAPIDLSGVTVAYYGGAGVAVMVGKTTGFVNKAPAWHLPRVVAGNKTGLGWTEVAGTVGVQVSNLYTAEVHVPEVRGFATGLRVHGIGNGVSYVTFHLGHLDNNQVSLTLGASAGGWANQNTFLGGRMSHNSNEGAQVAGTRHVVFEQATNMVNGNVFLGASLESPNVVEYHIECAGQYNTLLNARFENTGGDSSRRVWSRGSAKGNKILAGFNAGHIDETLSDTALPFDIESDVQKALRGGNSTTPVLLLENLFSSSAPAWAVMAAGAAGAGADPATAWTWRATSQRLEGKRATDTAARIRQDGVNGRTYYGDGATDPSGRYIGGFGSFLGVDGANFVFPTDNTYDLGTPAYRPRYVHAGTAFRLPSYTTAGRPNPATVGAGGLAYDSTLGGPITSTGTSWVEPPSKVYRGTGADQAAFAAVLAGLTAGEKIRVRGTVALTSTVEITAPGVTVELAPNANITTTVATADAIRVTAADVTIRGGKITSPATFDGANVEPTFAVIHGTAAGLRVQGVTLVNVPKVGIFADEADDLAVTDCRIHGNYPPGSWSGTQTGHFGIAVDPSTSTSAGRALIRGNIIRSCVQGIYLGNYGSGAGYGAVITGNVLDGCHNHGVYNAGGVDAVTVTGNAFTRCSLPVALTGPGHVVAGNTLHTHATGNNLDLIGISLREPVGCSVTGNTIRGDAPTGSVVIDLGNYVAGSTALSKNTVTGNTVTMTAGTSVGIRVGRSTQTEECHDNVITGNVITGAGSPGVGLITVAPKAGAAARGNKITGNALVVTGESYGIYLGVSQHATVQGNSVRFEYTAATAKVLAGIALAGATRALVTGNDFVNVAGFGANVTLRGVWEFTGTTGCVYALNRHDPATGLAGYVPFVGAAGSNPLLEEWITPTGGDDTAWLNAYLSAGVSKTRRILGAFTISDPVTVPAGVTLDATGASITQTGTNKRTLILAAGARLIGGELIGKGTDYVAGSTQSCDGVYTTAADVTIDGTLIRGFAGSGIRASGTTGLIVANTRVRGVGTPTITPGDGASCWGIWIDGGTGATITNCEASDACQGLITSIGTADLRINGLHVHDIPGQHGAYLQDGNGLTVTGLKVQSINLNGCKLQLAASSPADSVGATFTGVVADGCGDTALSINNTAADLTSAKKIRGLTINGLSATNCFRALYVGSVRGGSISNVAAYDTGGDGITLLDCHDVTLNGAALDVVGRIGVRLTSMTGSSMTRVGVHDVRVNNAANEGVANNVYGVYIAQGSYVTVDGLTVTADNGLMDYGLFFAGAVPADQETFSLRNADLSGDTGTSARFQATITGVRDWTNNRMTGSVMFKPDSQSAVVTVP